MTLYRVKAGNQTLEVEIPTGCQDTAFAWIEDEAGRSLVGIDLAHGGVVAGYWPDEEEWVDVLHVDNPIGDNFDESAPSQAIIVRHPALDDPLAVARAVGVLDETQTLEGG